MTAPTRSTGERCADCRSRNVEVRTFESDGRTRVYCHDCTEFGTAVQPPPSRPALPERVRSAEGETNLWTDERMQAMAAQIDEPAAPATPAGPVKNSPDPEQVAGDVSATAPIRDQPATPAASGALPPAGPVWTPARGQAASRCRILPWLEIIVQPTGPGLVGRPPRWFFTAATLSLFGPLTTYATREEAQVAALAFVRTALASALALLTTGGDRA